MPPDEKLTDLRSRLTEALGRLSKLGAKVHEVRLPCHRHNGPHVTTPVQVLAAAS